MDRRIAFSCKGQWVLSAPHRLRMWDDASATMTSAMLFAAFCLLVPTAVAAQAQAGSANPAPGQGVFPDASFEMALRKYTRPGNAFSPFYSWDAHMALSLTAYRRGSNAMDFRSVFQTVGTENFGARVGVGGTGYLIGFSYVHTYSSDFTLSAGIAHLSSHLTRDLDEKVADQRQAGAAIPVVADPSEFNVLFVRAYRKLSAYPFTPEIEIIVEPVSFRFNGRRRDNVRPVYLSSRSTLWQGRQTSLVAETQHEIGPNPFNRFTLLLELSARNEPEGRLQVFLSASPGHQLHVSPIVGAVRDGIAFGIRMKFRG